MLNMLSTIPSKLINLLEISYTVPVLFLGFLENKDPALSKEPVHQYISTFDSDGCCDHIFARCQEFECIVLILGVFYSP